MFLYFFRETLNNAGRGFMADCWALGVVLFHLLTGELPFEVDISDCHLYFRFLKNQDCYFVKLGSSKSWWMRAKVKQNNLLLSLLI